VSSASAPRISRPPGTYREKPSSYSGNYGGKPVKEVAAFIERSCHQGGKVAVFGTSAGDRGNEVAAIEKLLVKKGVTVVGGFHCPGKFLFFLRRGHPSEEDLKKAREFARATAKAK
jgi:hypothetical protein